MSKFFKLKGNSEFEIWEFQPDLIHAFPFYLEPVSNSWRIRCCLEYFVGYRVYYIRMNNEWAGYCVISSGRNPRYKFANNDDVIFGRYFISEQFRGYGLGLRMLREILDNIVISYKYAYAYLRITNIASYRTISKLKAERLYRFNIVGLTRRFKKSANGEFVLFKYVPERR